MLVASEALALLAPTDVSLLEVSSLQRADKSVSAGWLRLSLCPELCHATREHCMS